MQRAGPARSMKATNRDERSRAMVVVRLVRLSRLVNLNRNLCLPRASGRNCEPNTVWNGQEARAGVRFQAREDLLVRLPDFLCPRFPWT